MTPGSSSAACKLQGKQQRVPSSAADSGGWSGRAGGPMSRPHSAPCPPGAPHFPAWGLPSVPGGQVLRCQGHRRQRPRPAAWHSPYPWGPLPSGLQSSSAQSPQEHSQRKWGARQPLRTPKSGGVTQRTLDRAGDTGHSRCGEFLGNRQGPAKEPPEGSGTAAAQHVVRTPP